MALYRRFAVYLYQYQGARKGAGAGFGMIELRDGRIRMQLTGRGSAAQGNLEVYGLLDAPAEMAGVRLGSMQAGRFVLEAGEDIGEGKLFSDLRGIVLTARPGSERAVAALWNGTFDAGKFVQWKAEERFAEPEGEVQLPVPEGAVPGEESCKAVSFGGSNAPLPEENNTRFFGSGNPSLREGGKADLYKENRAELCEDESPDLREESRGGLCEESRVRLCEDESSDLCEESRGELCEDEIPDLRKESRAGLYEDEIPDLRKESRAGLYEDEIPDLRKESRVGLCEDEISDLHEEDSAEWCQDRCTDLHKERGNEFQAESKIHACVERSENWCDKEEGALSAKAYSSDTPAEDSGLPFGERVSSDISCGNVGNETVAQHAATEPFSQKEQEDSHSVPLWGSSHKTSIKHIPPVSAPHLNFASAALDLVEFGTPLEIESVNSCSTEPMGESPLWQRLSKQYPKMNIPVHQGPLSCLRIRPCDINRLPRENWKYGCSHFLARNYNRYRCLILGRTQHKNGWEYFMGVPGGNTPQERKQAAEAGFDHYIMVEKGHGQWPEGFWLVQLHWVE